MKKQVGFQYTLLNNTPYSPLPWSIATGNDVDVQGDEPKFTLSSVDNPILMSAPTPMVAVEVKDSKHGTTHIWSLEKLRLLKLLLYCIYACCYLLCYRSRLTNMRQLYETACHQEQNHNKKLSPPHTSGYSGIPGGDPFYDRYPWFRLIGRLVIVFYSFYTWYLTVIPRRVRGGWKQLKCY